MSGIKTEILRRKPEGMAAKIIHGIEEVFAVVPACIRELHSQREFDFEGIVAAAEHIQCCARNTRNACRCPIPSRHPDRNNGVDSRA